jgi:CRP-like cAMP-binding protein
MDTADTSQRRQVQEEPRLAGRPVGMRKDVRRKVELLRRLDVLAGAGRRELEALARHADEVRVPRRTTLLREGTTGRELVLVLEGEVEIVRAGQVLNRVGPGSVLGEIALVTGAPRTATARTITPARLVVITDLAYRSFASARTRGELRASAAARAST